MFEWLGKSIEKVTAVPPNSPVQLDDPTGPTAGQTLLPNYRKLINIFINK
jgi:hypothetical protein